jgi:hypothetical protein
MADDHSINVVAARFGMFGHLDRFAAMRLCVRSWSTRGRCAIILNVSRLTQSNTWGDPVGNTFANGELLQPAAPHAYPCRLKGL